MSKTLSVALIGVLLSIPAMAFAEEEKVLPRYMTEEESRPEPAGTIGFLPWAPECNRPDHWFTDTPPKTSRFPTESEQLRGVMYGWPSYGPQMSPLTELIRNAVQQDGYETTVMVPNAFRASAESTLRNRGFDDAMIARINWFITPLDGIWIRDYGAEPLVTQDGSVQFIDMAYYSRRSATCTFSGGQGSRVNDDVSPTLYAHSADFPLSGIDVFRPALKTEGGDLQTDGMGTCVHMQRDVLRVNRDPRLVDWSYTQEELDAVYSNYFNCSRVISLESLMPDPGPISIGQRTVIDHVDMFMSFISPFTIIVARLDPEDAAIDPQNAAILDRNAQRLSDAGYNIVRIPQPARYCTLRRTTTCVANPGDTLECVAGTPNRDRVWATYANSIRIGNRMMVPIYRDPVADGSPLPQDVKDRIFRQEADALSTFQAALDVEYGEGVVQVVPVVSDDMIPCQGSMHCISMTYGP